VKSIRHTSVHIMCMLNRIHLIDNYNKFTHRQSSSLSPYLLSSAPHSPYLLSSAPHSLYLLSSAPHSLYLLSSANDHMHDIVHMMQF